MFYARFDSMESIPLFNRFNVGEVKVSNISDETKDSYQWNPCDAWTAKPQTSPNETTKNHCKDVAVRCLYLNSVNYGIPVVSLFTFPTSGKGLLRFKRAARITPRTKLH